MANIQTLPESDIITYKFVLQQADPAPANFTSLTDTQNIFLFGMPNGYAVCCVKINPQISFTGSGLATMTCSVGPTGSVAYYAPAFNIMQSAAIQVTSPLLQYQFTAHDVNANFITTGAAVDAVSAGYVEITIQIRQLP
jgi:hypothetical protein